MIAGTRQFHCRLLLLSTITHRFEWVFRLNKDRYCSIPWTSYARLRRLKTIECVLIDRPKFFRRKIIAPRKLSRKRELSICLTKWKQFHRDDIIVTFKFLFRDDNNIKKTYLFLYNHLTHIFQKSLHKSRHLYYINCLKQVTKYTTSIL